MTVQQARDYWRAGKAGDALQSAWAAYDANPDGREEKFLVTRFLREEPQLLAGARAAAIERLLADPDVEPATISTAVWRLLERDSDLFVDASPEATARKLEGHSLALTALREDVVVNTGVERALTAVRRWLLLSGRWRDFPRLGAALIAQAGLNGGAWLFDDEERRRLDGDTTPAYLPPRPFAPRTAAYGDGVTRAVAQQYEAWPYPVWTRIARGKPISQAQAAREIDPDGPPSIPDPADILVAGCGTGRQVAMLAAKYPRDRLTAIDISAASLAYAQARCRASGFADAQFVQCDLHAVESLGRRFDAIHCTGVLHHLPDPEAGWAALTRALKPGGVMHIMVYSRVARMRILALRRALGALTERAVDDDLLRDIRRQVLALPPAKVPLSRDFFNLAGVHDLLLHRHEDPFDIPRIRRALDALGLQFLRFELGRQSDLIAYRARHPDDPLRRSFEGWQQLERDKPTIFAAMYDFWCRKPL